MSTPLPQVRVLAGVGAYNEERTIGDVLARFEPGTVDEIVVMDDGSTDATPQVIARFPVTHLRHETNRGAGAGIKSMIRYGLEHDYDVFVVMAGNGKDDPQQISRLLAPILDQGYDYVQGSRFMRGGSRVHLPLQRTILLRLVTLLYRVLTGFPCTDPNNGFRAYRLSILDDPHINIWQEWLDRYEMEHYLNYLVLKRGYRVTEVPVSKTYPAGRRVRYSHVRPIVDWWSGLRPIFYLVLGLKR
ncbi:MAG TPA: glycosyltransferase family 2 protein [Anaerolineae bacterium]|nr:glycosyltransferase family 2 protein [Anaerolineae bacterium]